jgi:hypothetical protein
MIQARAAAHVHSEWSYDAEWSLHDIARSFRRLRYDVVLMAEHDRGFSERRWNEYQVACAEASTEDILLVPGIEYEDAENVVHTPVWGIAVPFLGSARRTFDILRAANEYGAAAIFAHPWRRHSISRFAPEWAPLLNGVEVWNRRYDGIAPRQGAKALADREAVAPFVSLDFHTARQFFPLAMSLGITGPLTTASVIDAIRDNACAPEFFGFPALRFTQGIEGELFQALEGGRRKLRPAARWLRHRATAPAASSPSRDSSFPLSN